MSVQTKQIEKVQKSRDDVIVSTIGQFGRWQLMVCLILALVKPQSAWAKYSILFLTPSTKYRCAEFEENSHVEEVHNSTCYSGCEQYEYDTSPMQSNIISEWDLVCERRWMASFTQSVLMFGVMVGSVLIGFLMDRFGRRLAFIGGSVVTVLSMLIAPFVGSYWLFTLVRFVMGCANGGVVVVSSVVSMEVVGPRHREIVGVLLLVPYYIGQSSLSAFAYYFRTWESFLASIAVAAVITLSFILFMPESPRWLFSVGRNDDAMNLLIKASKCNNLSRPNICAKVVDYANELNKTKSTKTKNNYLDLFRTSTLRVRSAACCILWLLKGLCIYGVNQYITLGTSNIFAKVAITGMLLVPANLIGVYFNRRFGRKRTIVTSFFTGGVFTAALGFIPKTHWSSFALGVLGVSFISVAHSTVVIFTSELFPTVVRGMGMGISSTASRVGSILAPFVANMAIGPSWLPAVIMGMGAITAALVCLVLPETRGKNLIDTVEDETRQAGLPVHC